MLLKLILNALLVYALYRLARIFWTPKSPRPGPRAAPSNLDPGRAVRARWREETEESEVNREE